MSEEVKKLVKARGILKGQLTKFGTFLTTCGAAQLSQLRVRLAKAEGTWEKFETIQMEIESGVAQDEDQQQLQARERSSFEDDYFEVIALGTQKIEQFTANVATHSRNQNNDNNNIGVKLPVLTLPTFDGSYSKWLMFKDSFQSLIDSHASLSNVQKLQYLRSSLKDEALHAIQSIETSGANYQVAWQLLTSRYENKRLILNKHLKELFDLAPAGKENSSGLRQFISSIRSNLRSLEALGIAIQEWDAILIYLISGKLEFTTRRDWEIKMGDRTLDNLPTVEEFLDFLNGKSQMLEMMERTKTKFDNKSTDNKSSEKKIMVTTVGNNACKFCEGQHPLFGCDEFLKLPVERRQEEVKRLKLCLNCLRPGHFGRECRSSSCRQCSRKHNTLLHVDHENSSPSSSSNTKSSSNNTKTSDDHSKKSSFSHDHSKRSSQGTSQSSRDTDSARGTSMINCAYVAASQVLLATAQVYVYDHEGKRVRCRALLDPGSQSHVITAKLQQRLRLPTSKINQPISGIYDLRTNIKHSANVKMESTHYNYSVVLDCLVVPTITAKLPSVQIELTTLNIPKEVPLADPQFYIPGDIDMLIGSALFWRILCIGQTRLGKTLPTLQKTLLGWVVGGEISGHKKQQQSICCLQVTQLEGQLDRFFRNEEIAEKTRRYTKEEDDCLKEFEQSLYRDQGRFTVSLPKRENVELGDSREGALSRLRSLERRLAKNPALKKEYAKFLREYEALNHMSEITEESEIDNATTYYLPHQAVVRESSLTTKVRVVFDASAKTTSGYSLNDKLMPGPNLQEDLISLVLRFRTHQVVLTADIMKMFRQINVDKKDRSLQRILWREEPHLPLKIYELNTVTYGTTCAPFLAIGSLKQLAKEEASTYPTASRILDRDFYMDDVLTGTTTFEEAVELQKELSHLLEAGGFPLRKWRCNDKRVLEHLSEDRKADNLLFLDEDKAIKTLGLLWNTNQDILQYQITLSANNRCTKRNILSKIAQIYDPLGLIGPVLITAKMIMQELWTLQVGWDQPVPQSVDSTWKSFYDSLTEIGSLKVERNVNPGNASNKIIIHGFADASEKGYGACVYAVSYAATGEAQSRLMCSKSKVAPLKPITLPRLELNAALLLSRLIEVIRKSLGEKIQDVYLWTDSTIVLHWLKTPPTQLKTFEANRVAEIQELTSEALWSHVPTTDNPADVVSRGTTAKNLLTHQLWWHGPMWLAQRAEWPQTSTEVIGDVPGIKSICTITLEKKDQTFLPEVSSFDKLKRIMAYVLRFKRRCKREGQTGSLTIDDLEEACTEIIRVIQREKFLKEIEDLRNNKQVHKKSRLISLKPFLDKQGLLRAGGRLRQAEISADQKNPIIIPAKHFVTKLIMKNKHEKLHHCGPEQLLSVIRQQYWPISGRNEARNVTRRCITCFRYQPHKIETAMGDLPQERLTGVVRPFYTCGVDYAGPLQVRESKRRGRIHISKAYIAVFTCFHTKAVHLELVSDLTTEAFLAALRRFISRRGLCRTIFSDNGTNFVGAARELREVYQFLSENVNDITQDLVNRQIEWKFIPPRAPHFGGLWEAAVKATKRHLYKIVQNLVYTFEEYYTLLTEIEAILNSRPLTPLSSDPTDLTALCPAHFLIGDLPTEIAQKDYTNVPDRTLSRWEHTQKLKQHFWQRWYKEYLHQLQTRTKWTSGEENVKVGSMVLLVDDNLPAMKWSLGRVVETHPGDDNIVRVVTVKTSTGLFKRAVRKLCKLPIDE